MYKFITKQDFDHTKTIPEIHSDEEITVPNMAMSVEEILEKHSRGLSTTVGQKIPIYQSNTAEIDELLPDLNKLDLAEIELLKKATAERMEQIKRDLAEVQLNRKIKAENELKKRQNEEAIKNYLEKGDKADKQA